MMTDVERLQHKLDERDRLINALLKVGVCNCKRTWAGTLTEECHYCWARRQAERIKRQEVTP